MAGITTAMPTSFKAELLQGGHCLVAGTFTFTGTMSSGAHGITAVSSLAGVVLGEGVQSGTSLAANTVIESIVSATSITVSETAAGAISGGTFTVSPDVFKMALIKHTPAGTYGAASVNYTDITGNSDEVSGAGYSAGGLALTNVTPLTSGTTAYSTPGGTIQWTSATIDADGCMIYNTNARMGGTSGTNTTGAGRAAYTGDFGGEQKVTAGTFTVVAPTNNSSTGLWRLA